MNYKIYIILGALLTTIDQTLKIFSQEEIVKSLRNTLPLEFIAPIGLMSLLYGVYVWYKKEEPLNFLQFILCNIVSFIFVYIWMWLTLPLTHIGLRFISTALRNSLGEQIQQSIVRSDFSSWLVQTLYFLTVCVVYICGFILARRALLSHKK